MGREVESMVRDLVDVAIKMTREQEMEKVRVRAEETAEDRLLDALLPPPLLRKTIKKASKEAEPSGEARRLLRKKLREGDLNDKEIDVDIASMPVGIEIMGHRDGGCH